MSTSGSVAISTSASLPASILTPAGSFPTASRAAFSSVSATTAGCSRSHWRNSSSAFRRAAAAYRRKCSGSAAITVAAERPIEPVAPSTAMFLMSAASLTIRVFPAS